jgi:formamidopyrimidine-DNA glycosylase
LPELPDIDTYVAALENRIQGKALAEIRIGNPFLIRSVSPSPADVHGHTVRTIRRLGKRIAIGFDNDIWLVLHLMIAGRLHWKAGRPGLGSKRTLAALDFEDGSLLLTEAGSKKRASLYVVAGTDGLERHDPGGLEPLECGLAEFAAAIRGANHTLKRALTDPRILSGIGNAYSDEILHAARLSPVQLTSKLSDAAVERLFEAMRSTLGRWREELMRDAAGDIPSKVTAFREGMAVHGRYGLPCPDCGEPVQRIRYKDNETDYCARCQTGSRILKDRSLSRLLRKDWPRTLDDL